MRWRIERGGVAALELALVVPFIALFIVVTIQFAAILHRLIEGRAGMENLVSRRTLHWEMDNRSRGFMRPCLENLEREHEDGNRREIYIVARNICQN